MECLLSFHLFSSSLFSKNINIKIYRTTVLLVVLYGCETWSLTIREEHRLRVLDNRVLRKISGPKRVKGQGNRSGEDCTRSFIICTPHTLLSG